MTYSNRYNIIKIEYSVDAVRMLDDLDTADTA